jgi:RND family efflux transporter MFP subunit
MSDGSLKYILLAATVLGSFSLTACTKKETPTKADPVVLVSPAEPATGTADRSNGIVESLSNHIVASEASGRLTHVKAMVGDRVVRGQVLAIIDAEPNALQAMQVQAELKSAELELRLKQSNLDRIKGLTDAGTVSAADLERAQTEFNAAQQAVIASRARTGLAQRAARETVIRSPVDGIVTARNAQPSQVSAAGTTLFEIEAGKERVIRTVIPSASAQSLKTGQGLTYEHGGKLSTASVLGVSARAAATGAQEVTLSVDNDAPLPGTPVTVLFSSNLSNSLSVPASAITVSDNGVRSVFIVNDQNKVSSVPVEVLQLSGTRAIVSGPVTPGVQIISAGTDWVKVGQKVTPQIMKR